MSMKKTHILGTGCSKCKKLAESAEAAAKELGLEYELEKATDITGHYGLWGNDDSCLGY